MVGAGPSSFVPEATVLIFLARSRCASSMKQAAQEDPVAYDVVVIGGGPVSHVHISLQMVGWLTQPSDGVSLQVSDGLPAQAAALSMRNSETMHKVSCPASECTRAL